MPDRIKRLIANINKKTDPDKFINSNQDCFLAIINGYILNPNYSVLKEGSDLRKEDILIYKDKIVAIGQDFQENLPADIGNICIIDAEGLTITPGLIDQHIHGGYGVDFNNADVEDIINLTENLPSHGITSILPTIMTAPESIIKEQINKVKTAKQNQPINSTKLLGIHLEGPYLCSKYKGIQPETEIIKPKVANFQKIEDSEIKIVSYAPELDEGFELTKYLASKNIIPSAGHSSASCEDAKNVSEHGA